MRKVLLIEDDPTITDFMEVVLAKEHYHVTIATTGMEALHVFQEDSFDLILLDLGLPDIDGIELLKIIRKRLATPLIVISARNNEHEKVKALDLGADDYVTKPFGMNELLARIRTAFRHRKQEELPSVITNGELSLDTESQLLTKAGEPIHLTKNEYRILLVLFQHLGKRRHLSRINIRSLGALRNRFPSVASEYVKHSEKNREKYHSSRIFNH